MLEVMPWPALPVAQIADTPVARVQANLHTAVLGQHRTQIADAPNRYGPAAVLRAPLQGFGKKREVLRAQLRRPARSWPIGESVTTVLLLSICLAQGAFASDSSRWRLSRNQVTKPHTATRFDSMTK